MTCATAIGCIHWSHPHPFQRLYFNKLMWIFFIDFHSNDTHFGFGVEKESLRHCSSLPCVLDGEALFIEDLKQADNLTHQTSLAYLDLGNATVNKFEVEITAHASGDIFLINCSLYRYINCLQSPPFWSIVSAGPFLSSQLLKWMLMYLKKE